MEAVAVGASVLAFVTLSLKSAKAVQEVLSSAKEGQRHVGQVERDVQSLQLTLERLSRCRLIGERRDEALAAKIKACSDDMEIFAKRLESLAIGDAEPRLGRQWKRIKAFLNEKDLAKMGAVVVGHTVALNLHLNILESDTLFDVRDQLGAVDRQGLSIQQIIRESQSTVIEQQTTMTATVRETMAQIEDETRSILDAVHATLLGPTTQGDQMIRMLNQLLEQLPRLSAGHSVDARVIEVQEDMKSIDETPSEEILPHAELAESVELILGAIHDKKGVFGLNEAEDVIDSLLGLLKTMVSDRFLESAAESVLTYRRWCQTCTKRDLATLRRNLMAVQGIILSAGRVSVNEASKRALRAGTFIEIHGKTRSCDLANGVVSVVSLERSWQKQRPRPLSALAASQEPMDVAEKEIETQICFVPRAGSPRQGFQVMTRQYHDFRRTYNVIPRISVINILPASSHVFSLVKQGRMTEFQEMLRSRRASLTDHDEFGASLLFYANHQPEMCRFLLQHGVNVDHVASYRGSAYIELDYTGTALLSHVNDDEAEGDELKDILTCRKLLIEAGCDPTIPIFDNEGREEGTAFSSAFEFGVPEAMKISLDSSHGFVTVESFTDIDLKWTPLLQYCDGGRLTVDGLSILIDRGANIHARDLYGRTCLHLCFISWRMDIAYQEQARSGLAYLLRHGADAAAVDEDNISVSEYAYIIPHGGTSLKGDVWDVVLADCGFDIVEFRQQSLRTARYGHGYTRHDFEELWAGQEYLCPYYDEEFWTTDEESGDDAADELDDSSHSSDGGGVML